MFEDLNGKKFDLIYADPPWRYNFHVRSADAIEVHYPTMEVEDIMAMPIFEITKKDCILYMWATAPKLYEAMRVITAWGFEYITGAVWDKQKLGLGHWFRIQHEHLLIARKGKISPPPKEERLRSIISVPKTSKHSQKPKMHYFLDKFHPDLEKIELFARDRDLFMLDWAVWGNEV